MIYTYHMLFLSILLSTCANCGAMSLGNAAPENSVQLANIANTEIKEIARMSKEQRIRIGALTPLLSSRVKSRCKHAWRQAVEKGEQFATAQTSDDVDELLEKLSFCQELYMPFMIKTMISDRYGKCEQVYVFLQELCHTGFLSKSDTDIVQQHVRHYQNIKKRQTMRPDEANNENEQNNEKQP